jgi:hypothetical protein
VKALQPRPVRPRQNEDDELPEFGTRNAGPLIPGGRLAESASIDPSIGQPSLSAQKPSASPPVSPLFRADIAGGRDHLFLGGPLAVLAELIVHSRTETPLTIGLLGGRGSGKSSALVEIVRSIEAAPHPDANRSEANRLGRVHVVPIDASRLDGTATVALADNLHASLVDPYPALVGEAIHASRDPRLAAREAFEALDTARRKLSGERSALETEEARRAGLTEVVLFETPGTRIDAYARANRSTLKKRLAGLGIEGEPIRAFKQLVFQTMDGASARLWFVLRSFWNFKGQATLVVLALLASLAGIAAGLADSERAAWLGRLRDLESTRAIAAWFEANIGLLDDLRRISFLAAGAAVAINIFRALRLVLPVFRAGTLLTEDLTLRRRQADVEFGHETRRVESLATEVDVLARRAAEAERRAGDQRTGNGAVAEASPFLDDPAKRQAERFIAAIGKLVGTGNAELDAKGSSKPRAIEAPERIVIALDGLDQLEPARAGAILGTVHKTFGPDFVVLIATDPERLKRAGADQLDCWIQVPFQVAELSLRNDPSALVHAMLDPGLAQTVVPSTRDEERIALDLPLSDAETRLLAELAPLAGASPRNLKRFVNLYRLARVLCPEHLGILALSLALDAGGTVTEIAAFEGALGAPAGYLNLDMRGAGPRLAAASISVRQLMGDETLLGARQAAEIARLFSFGPQHAPR